LYSDEADQSDYTEFVKRTKNIKVILDKAIYRQKSMEERPELVNNYLKKLESLAIKTREYHNKHDWLNQSDVNDVNNMIEEVTNHINIEFDK